jgi:hypothetical protein
MVRAFQNCAKLLYAVLKIQYIMTHKCESPITALKILYTLIRGPLNFEAIAFSLSNLYVNLALVEPPFPDINNLSWV